MAGVAVITCVQLLTPLSFLKHLVGFVVGFGRPRPMPIIVALRGAWTPVAVLSATTARAIRAGCVSFARDSNWLLAVEAATLLNCPYP